MRITEKKICWQGSFLRTIILKYKDQSGNLRDWEAVERVNCNGVVAIIPVTTEEEILLVRQFRPVVNNFVIEIPAGLNDKGEISVEAARRELLEETGYSSNEFILIARGPLSSGMSAEMMDVFIAKNAFPAPSHEKALFKLDDSEEIELIKTPLRRVYYTLEDCRKAGDLIDLKIYGFIELTKTFYKSFNQERLKTREQNIYRVKPS